jgi:hypothetical protein
LQAFGTEWVRKWAILKERLVEIAKVMRRFPWMVDVVRQRPVSNPHPYMVEVYVAVDGSEVSLVEPVEDVLCKRRRREGGAVGAGIQAIRDTRRQDKKDYRPKGLLAFATAAREYVRIL